MPDASSYALLGKINNPKDLRDLPESDLSNLAVELRRFLIETLGRIGGHFAANLGTVELTIALHYIYNTPEDRITWDVGHQAYPHKILTGRRAQLESIRRLNGLMPFPHRDESPYDAFGVGHSSTSISAAVGMAMGAAQAGVPRKSIAVIGDGGITGGMAFEALNHLGSTNADVLVILNDNDMSISENVGAMRDHSARILGAAETEMGPEDPRPRRPAERALDFESKPGALFHSLGLDYVGPIDGHDLPLLLQTLAALKEESGPRVLHINTTKGKGFLPAEQAPITYHGVTQFDPVTGEIPKKTTPPKPTYTHVFGDWICDAAAADERVHAITPAMREGSGLVQFQKDFPERYHDVAIAEQHAITFAAGLACEGRKPVVAIYSSFLQRGYDQLIHDVAIQNLPVMFAIDRGGLVGADGATHHGSFDLAFMRCVPNMVIMAPSDEQECRKMLSTGLTINGPSAVRYPRGSGTGVQVTADLQPLAVGKANIVRQAKGRRTPRVAILAFGAMLPPALAAADILDADVVDMRFIKPLDEAVILEMANQNDLIVTVEDNVLSGGAGSAVNEVLIQQHDLVRVLNLGLPDDFVEHGSREELLQQCDLDSTGILRAIQKRLRARDMDIKASPQSGQLKP